MGPDDEVVISPLAEAIFGTTLTGRMSVSELARVLRAEERTVRDEVDRLAAWGIVSDQDGWVRPLPPRVPIERLVETQAKRLDATRASVETMVGLWTRRHGAPEPVEVILDEEVATDVSRNLMDATRSTVDALCTGPVSARTPLPNADAHRPPVGVHDGLFEALERGVRVRTVYDASVLQDAPVLALVNSCIEASEEGRVCQRVPLNLVIFDDDRVVLSVPGDGVNRRMLVVIHDSGLLDVLRDLFGVFWGRGFPLTADAGDGAATSDDTEARRLISYLAAGLTDEAIARELSISTRTLGRRIARLEETLDARGRFQLAIQASRRGWV